MRLFIAASLPQNIQWAIQTQQIKYDLPGVRFVPVANLHLTLHFIGETPATILPDLFKNLNYIAQTHSAFNLSLKEIAPGPKLKSPRLIWARFQEHPAFEALARATSAAVSNNVTLHSDFIPHITIARLKKEILIPRALPVISNIDFPVYPVNSFALWQSELGSPHPRYSVLQEFKLASTAE